jgi:glyoxylase-like metal-dependent hydrolase (beta-lactamase superfamily II)
MRIALGVEMLEIEATLTGVGPSTIHPALVWDETEAVLVDAGLPGSLPQFRKAIEKAGVPFERLTRIAITHHDMDHIGSLRSIVATLPKPPEVLAHESEVPYIQAELPPIRLAQIEAQLPHLPEGQQRPMQALHDKLAAGYSTFRTHVDHPLGDGEILPCCGGIVAIHSPGHTFGHLCLYLQASKVLIAGDAMNVEAGRLVPPPSFTLVDRQAAGRSLEKLTAYDIAQVICYHGGLLAQDANGQIAALAAASREH